MPGAPARADSPVLESDYRFVDSVPEHVVYSLAPRGKKVTEIDFDNTHCLHLDKFKACDYFDDGSFYLLDAPGHAVGHMMALVRTTVNPDTFTMLGADSIHDTGELRPSNYLPLPGSVYLLSHNNLEGGPLSCLGAWFEELQKKRGRTLDQSLFVTVHNHNIPDALKTIEKAQRFDGNNHIFFVFAHDEALKGIVDEFPMVLNQWQEKGWDRQSKWLFLRHYLHQLRAKQSCTDEKSSRR